ncbi:hypothetical protein [Actinomycetospora flava]|uniref:Uncharacterized protein n=1 Tax=Actinomycetospora flava TaxID=3129232 RepID=A0ABU8M7N6_9PSEU
MSGNSPELIARRPLLAGLGALVLIAGCGRTEARAAAPGPEDLSVQDWATQPDGPLPATDALGRPYVVRRSGVTGGPWIVGGALTAQTPADRGATYVNLDLGTRVERLGARFVFGPGNTDGSLCLAAWAGGVLPPGEGIRSATPVHLVVTPDRWLHGVVDDGALVVLASGGFDPVLPRDGTPLEVDVTLDGPAVTFVLPDGSEHTVSDPRSNSIAGTTACWEFYQDRAGGSGVRFHQTWCR